MRLEIVNPAVRELLHRSGWTEQRQFDTHAIRDYLASAGVEVNPAADAVLRQLHGIRLDLPNGPFEFDVRKAVSWLSDSDLPFLRTIIGQPLCPIGYGGRRFMLVSPDGEVILLNDEWLFFHRFSTLSEALDDICFPGKRMPEAIWLEATQQPPGYQDSD